MGDVLVAIAAVYQLAMPLRLSSGERGAAYR
jgi:hypothetical protein